MFIDLFVTLRKHKVPCSLRELLDLIALLKKGVVFANVEEFYHLAKIVMVKDEIHYDKFDSAFAEYFEGIQAIDIFDKILPEDWLRKEFEKHLSQEEKDKLEALGGLDQLSEDIKLNCKAALQKYCADVPPGPELMKCAENNKNKEDVPSLCQTMLEAQG